MGLTRTKPAEDCDGDGDMDMIRLKPWYEKPCCVTYPIKHQGLQACEQTADGMRCDDDFLCLRIVNSTKSVSNRLLLSQHGGTCLRNFTCYQTQSLQIDANSVEN